MGGVEGVPRGAEDLQLLVGIEKVHYGLFPAWFAEGDKPQGQFAKLGPTSLDKTSNVCGEKGGPFDGKFFKVRTALNEHVPEPVKWRPCTGVMI